MGGLKRKGRECLATLLKLPRSNDVWKNHTKPGTGCGVVSSKELLNWEAAAQRAHPDTRTVGLFGSLKPCLTILEWDRQQ